MPTKTPYFFFEKTAQSLTLLLLLGTGSFCFGIQQAPKVHLNLSHPQELSQKTQQLSWTFSQEMDVKVWKKVFRLTHSFKGAFKLGWQETRFFWTNPLGYDKKHKHSLERNKLPRKSFA